MEGYMATQSAPSLLQQTDSETSTSTHINIPDTSTATQVNISDKSTPTQINIPMKEKPVHIQVDSEVCRYCHDDATTGRLISPCSCAGSTRFVHHKCLLQWLATATARDGIPKVKCEICNCPFVGVVEERRGQKCGDKKPGCWMFRWYRQTAAVVIAIHLFLIFGFPLILIGISVYTMGHTTSGAALCIIGTVALLAGIASCILEHLGPRNATSDSDIGLQPAGGSSRIGSTIFVDSFMYI